MDILTYHTKINTCSAIQWLQIQTPFGLNEAFFLFPSTAVQGCLFYMSISCFWALRNPSAVQWNKLCMTETLVSLSSSSLLMSTLLLVLRNFGVSDWASQQAPQTCSISETTECSGCGTSSPASRRWRLSPPKECLSSGHGSQANRRQIKGLASYPPLRSEKQASCCSYYTDTLYL